MNTSIKAILLSATAALALTACNSKSDATDSTDSAKSSSSSSMSASKGSALDKPFKFKGGEEMDVDAFFSSMGMEGAFVYDSSAFDNKKGATVLTNLRMAGEQSPFTVGRLELYGVNSDAIMSMQAGGDGMSSMTDMFRKIRVYDLDSSFPMDGGGMGNLSLEALDIDSFSMKSVNDEGTRAMDEGKAFAMGAKSMELGGIAMKGFKFSSDESSELGKMLFNVANFSVGSYKAGKFGGFNMRDVSYELTQSEAITQEAMQAFGPAAGMIQGTPLQALMFPENQSGTIGSLKWDGMSFAGLLGYLEKGEKPPVSATNLLSVGGMEFLNTTQDVNGMRAASVKKVTISPIEFAHFMPKHIKIVSEGEKTDLTAYVGDEAPEILAILKKNGLDNVTGKSSMDFDYSPRGKTISFDMNSVAKGLADSKFSFDIGGFDYAAMMAEDSNPEAAMMGVTINGLTIRLDDDKLVDTAFAVAGQMTEQDPAALRQQVVGLISLGALQGGAISPRVPNYATALSTFISEGGSLEIKAAPASPASIAELAASAESNPGGALDTLNLTVKQSK